MIKNIEANTYERRHERWTFRRDFGPKEFLFRVLFLSALFFIAYMSKPGTPRGREDKEWLQNFAIVMMLWYAAIHAIAYLPSMLFGSFSDLMSACRGATNHAISEWRDYQYCAALIVAIIVLYPFIIFFYLIVDGFNPYDELTYAEVKMEGGLQADIVYIFRILLHLFLLVVTVYLIVLSITMYTLRNIQRYPGQYIWIAKIVTKMPYGSLFFEAGE